MEEQRECPCCGATLAVRGDVKWNAAGFALQTKHGAVVLTRKQGELFDVLWRNRGRFLTRAALVDILYADDIDGGVSDCAIGQAIYRLRVVLAPLGLKLIAGTRTGNGYRLLSTEPFEVRRRAHKKTGIWANDRDEYQRDYYRRCRKKKPAAALRLAVPRDSGPVANLPPSQVIEIG